MKPNQILSTFFITVALASGATAQAAQSERIFEGGLDTLREIYGTAALRIQDMSYRDVKMACAGVIFLEWQNAYLEVMRRTQLTLSNMALGEYGTFMSNVDANQRTLNTGRWGMVDRTKQEVLERRARVAGYPQGVRGLAFTGENVYRNELIANLVPCLDEEFGRIVDADVPQADLSRLDNTTYRVTWKQSSAGGIEPEWTKVEGGPDQRLRFLGRIRSLDESLWNALIIGR
jgi:hypothetical protein